MFVAAKVVSLLDKSGLSDLAKKIVVGSIIYFFITVLAAGIMMAFILVKGFKIKVKVAGFTIGSGRKSYADASCYPGHSFNQKVFKTPAADSISQSTSVGQNQGTSISQPANLNALGKADLLSNLEWRDTGHITNGKPLIVRATGKFFPSGVDNTPSFQVVSKTEDAGFKIQEEYPKCDVEEEVDKDNILNPPCYLEGGYGLYLRFGDSKYAYHLAQVKINQSTGGSVTYVPFSLPARDDEGNFKVNSGDCSYDPDVEKEDCAPEKNLKIYIARDASFSGYTGNIDVFFDSGVADISDIIKNNQDITNSKNETGLKQAYPSGAEAGLDYRNIQDASVFSKMAMFVFEPFFGKSIKFSGGLISEMDSKEGVFTAIRDSILASFGFQVIKIILLIMMIMSYGKGLFVGDESLSASKIMPKLLNIMFVVWATSPENYAFVDQILVPFFFAGFAGLSSVVSGIALSISGIHDSISFSDPFYSFDLILKYMFSESIGYKMLALLVNNYPFVLTMVLLWICMMNVVVLIVRTAVTLSLSVIMMGFMITISPLVIIGLLHDRTRNYFSTWKNMLISEGISGVVNMFFICLFFALLIRPFVEIFNFETCWGEVFSLDLAFISFTVDSWDLKNDITDTTYLMNFLNFAAWSVCLYYLRESFFNMADKIFGSARLPKINSNEEGERALNNIQNTVFGGGAFNFSPLSLILPKSSEIGRVTRGGISSFMSTPHVGKYASKIINMGVDKFGNKIFNAGDNKESASKSVIRGNNNSSSLGNRQLDSKSKNASSKQIGGASSDVMQNSQSYADNDTEKPENKSKNSLDPEKNNSTNSYAKQLQQKIESKLPNKQQDSVIRNYSSNATPGGQFSQWGQNGSQFNDASGLRNDSNQFGDYQNYQGLNNSAINQGIPNNQPNVNQNTASVSQVNNNLDNGNSPDNSSKQYDAIKKDIIDRNNNSGSN